MMKVLNIIHDSVVDGEGLRTVVFFAGCPHQCLGCHNPDSLFRSNGINMTLVDILSDIKIKQMNYVTFYVGVKFIQAIQIFLLVLAMNKLDINILYYYIMTY